MHTALNLVSFTGGKISPANVDYDSVIQVCILRHKWGVQRKISKEAMESMRSQGQDVREAIKGISKNLVENCAKYNQINKLDSGIKAYLSTANGIVIHAPWLGKARYLFPVATYKRAMDVVHDYVAKREKAVEEFLFEYETSLVDNEMRRLGPLAIREQYPPVSELEEKFVVDISFPPLDPRQNVEARLKLVDPDAYERALACEELKLVEGNEHLRYAQRRALLELTVAMRDAIGEGTGSRAGEYKRMRTDVYDRLKTFTELLHVRNLVGDAELQQIGDAIKGLLDAASLAQLKTDDEVRAQVKSRLAAAALTLEDLALDKPVGMVEVQDEE